MKKMIKIGFIFYLICLPLIVHAASDPRFFGTYCGNYEEKHGLRTYTLNIRASSDYKETSHGNGLITGHGNATIEGKSIPFVFSGVVTALGVMEGSGIAANMEPTFARAFLSADGNTLTFSGMDRVLLFGKDKCGNEAPHATIRNPGTGSFPWGDIIGFSGTVTDREDASFPKARVVWSSDRDGKLGNGLSIFKNNLSPGRHRITLAATDSGGRTSIDTVTITIQNTRPNTPVIEELLSCSLYAGIEIPFRGRASDREDGNLIGNSLVWSSSRDGNLGTGNLLNRALSAGAHTITLTATDHAGLSSSTTIRINVRSSAGNVPPSVAIISPVNHYAMGSNESFTFVARSTDLEDGLLGGRSLSWKDSYFEAGREVVRDLGIGASKNLENPPAPIADTRHVITVTATDSGGLSCSDSVVIYVIPGGLY